MMNSTRARPATAANHHRRKLSTCVTIPARNFASSAGKISAYRIRPAARPVRPPATAATPLPPLDPAARKRQAQHKHQPTSRPPHDHQLRRLGILGCPNPQLRQCPVHRPVQAVRLGSARPAPRRTSGPSPRIMCWLSSFVAVPRLAGIATQDAPPPRRRGRNRAPPPRLAPRPLSAPQSHETR